MSQEKVDRYKKEKKNRVKTIKKQKVKKAFNIFILCVFIGCLVGIPLGRGIYKYQKKKAAEHATISSLEYDTWFDDYWVENYYDLYKGVDYENNLDTEGSEESEDDMYEVDRVETEDVDVNVEYPENEEAEPVQDVETDVESDLETDVETGLEDGAEVVE